MQNTPYLPNLNGLRAISVLVVVLNHATSMQHWFGGYREQDWLYIPSNFGVLLFFCISGVLITYLLDREMSGAGRIDIGRFWIRRIARIWPLYFLIAVSALLLNLAVKGAGFYQPMKFEDYALIMLVLPGFADRPAFMGQTWSIAIEETFYMVYPLVMRAVSRTALICILIGIVFSYEILKVSAPLTCLFITQCKKLAHDYYWAPLYYGTIAIGALSYLIFSLKNDRINRILFSPGMQTAALSAAAMITTAATVTGDALYFDYRWIAFAFSIVIINAAFNKASILNLENRPLNFLGEISYGIYMYHIFVGCLVIAICWVFFKGDSFPLQNLIVCGSTFVLSVAVSWLSAVYFENPIRALAKNKPTEHVPTAGHLPSSLASGRRS